MIEKRPQIEKVLQTLTGATFFAIFSGGRGPRGGGLKGLMQPKVTQNDGFEGILLSIGFQKYASGGSGEHIFVKIGRQNA